MAVKFLPHSIPAMYVVGQGLSTAKIRLEYIIITLMLFAAVRFVLEYKRAGDKLVMMFSVALALSIFSELAFISYNGVYDIYNYLGHVYKVIAYYTIFRIMFICNVQKPYTELSEARNTLREYVDNLDRIVDQRTQELKCMNQKLLDDLEYARDIQKAILPASLPSQKEVLFSAKYFPAEKVSGDFYNIFKLDEDHIGLYIGDVSGHGVPAAILMVFMNQNIKSIGRIDENTYEIIRPSGVLDRIYEAFNRTTFKEEIYAVLFYAVYNIKERKLTYSSAGMNTQPLIIKNSGVISMLEINGFPICKFMDFYAPDYRDVTINLDCGDKLLFYTDGLVEAGNQESESFSQNRLIKILKEKFNMSCSELSDEIESEVFGFAGNIAPKDDITFFIMEVK